MTTAGAAGQGRNPLQHHLARPLLSLPPVHLLDLFPPLQRRCLLWLLLWPPVLPCLSLQLLPASLRSLQLPLPQLPLPGLLPSPARPVWAAAIGSLQCPSRCLHLLQGHLHRPVPWWFGALLCQQLQLQRLWLQQRSVFVKQQRLQLVPLPLQPLESSLLSQDQRLVPTPHCLLGQRPLQR